MSLLSPARLFTASIVTIACLFPANTMSAENTASLSNTAARPNVLFIAIDDLNDWVGCLNGHPQAQTPNIDRLARRGVLFTNAHVQATFCGPSRMSLLSGRFPASTGAYGFEPTYDRQPALKDLPSLPEWFRRHGYRTVGGGKIYHQGIQQGNAGGFEEDLGFGGSGPRPKELLNWHVPIWDFGPFPDRDEQVDNYRMAQAGADVLTAPRG
ncbi:MAG: sulfatase-like hydrolase/transferase, partial [Planctomycetaceae bacterium]|nr:sulfatase-like hydrolase/transferase [Planctomycetaceae bacterium]